MATHLPDSTTVSATDATYLDATASSIINALTIDLEDDFHLQAFKKQLERSQWDEWELRIRGNTRRLLKILARKEVRATFFVQGWIAERCPRLVEEIHTAGHEIGSHGYWNHLVYGQIPSHFRQEAALAKKTLEEITGTPVLAFRAPHFSINDNCLWAIQILAEEGYEIDSSILPIYRNRYGIPGALHEIHRIETISRPVWEVPPTICRVHGWDVPVGDGGYFRIHPLWKTLRSLRQINMADLRPFIFHIRPWEIDPEAPQAPGISTSSHLRYRLHLHKTSPLFERLLSEFRFAPLGEIIDHITDNQTEVPNVPLDLTCWCSKPKK